MLMIIFTVVLVAAAGAEDTQNEITSNSIMLEKRSTDKEIESSLDHQIDRAPAAAVVATMVPQSNQSQKLSRRSRYQRQAPRSRRRPPYDVVLPRRNVRRPGAANNFPNLYGPPRNRFKPNGYRPYRQGPPKSRYHYYRENWRQKWPEQNQPYYNEAADEGMEEMDQEPSYGEYDDIDEYKNEEVPWYSKKYRDNYDDDMPVPSKYNEKRSPPRYMEYPRQKQRVNYDTPSYMEYPRQKQHRSNYDLQEAVHKDSHTEWPEHNRLTRNYREYMEMMSPPSKIKYMDEDMPVAGGHHRLKLAHPNRLKAFDEEEYDFSATANQKNRRIKAENPVIMQIRRPSSMAEETRFEHVDFADISKYLSGLHNTQPAKEAAQEVAYSAKYRDHKLDKEEEDTAAKVKTDHTHSASDNWKQDQKQTHFHSPFISPSKTLIYGNKNTATDNMAADNMAASAKSQNYVKDDRLLPSELIAYMSADPTVVAKEERYLHAAYPALIEKLSDHDDILKSTYARKISPIIDHQDLEITFDQHVGDWKH